MNPDQTQESQTAAKSAKDKLYQSLLGDQAVSGVGIGKSADGGTALLVFLKQDHPDLTQQLHEYAGFPVEYMVTGPVVAFAKDWTTLSMPKPEAPSEG